MAKIDSWTSGVGGDTGAQIKTKLLEAQKSVETEGTYIEGDGNVGTPVDLTTAAKTSLGKADSAVQNTGNETIAGVKTFTSSPIVPAPTTDLQAATKKYVDDAVVAGGGYTDADAQDAVGNILTDSSEIDFTYTANTSITAALKSGSIDETKLDASVNASLDKADSALQSSDIGVTVQAYSAVLAATTASFTTADESKLDGIEANADVTDATNVNAAGAVMNSDYNQSHSVLVQQNSSGSPEIVNFNNNSILGKGGGDIAALTPAEVRSIINVEDNADVTDTDNVRSAGALMDDEVTNLADVKAFDPANYATAAQGTKADSALQDLVDDTTPQLGGDLDLNGNKILALPCEIGIACSDETTALTTGTAKATFRIPYAMTLTAVRASLTGAGSTSGTTTIDINESGTTVLSTKLTIDAGEKTSTTAATPAVISDSALADDAEITIDIDAVSGGADETGLKVWLIGTRA